MKTFEDIEKLAMTDPVVHKCMMLYRQGDFTKEQALIHMVATLAEHKNDYFNEVVKLRQNR